MYKFVNFILKLIKIGGVDPANTTASKFND